MIRKRIMNGKNVNLIKNVIRYLKKKIKKSET